MVKRKLGLVLFGLIAIIVVAMVGGWWWHIPGIPESWRGNFRLNAKILPASDSSRSLYLTVNPNFRAEFGERDNPSSAFLRFEVTGESDNDTTTGIQENLWTNFQGIPQLFKDYYPGLEWQLFSVGIDETQIASLTEFSQDEEILRLSKEILNPQLEATVEADVEKVMSAREDITTTTTLARRQGYDVIENLAVAKDTDLHYQVLPGEGVQAEIAIGDRQDFDTACLKLLSLTGSTMSCDLPYNRFSFLMQVDSGLELKHTPLSIDGGSGGSHYLVNSDQEFLLRLGNWHLVDAAGQTSDQVQLSVRPGEVDGVVTEGFYIITITADLNWLLESERVFPVRLQGGFFTSNQDFFITSN